MKQSIYKTFIIEKKLSEPRKNFWNPEKYFRVKKTKQKKIMKSRKKIKIVKNISKSRKMFQNRELLQESRKNLEFNDLEFNEPSANIYLFKVNNRNTRKRFEICYVQS